MGETAVSGAYPDHSTYKALYLRYHQGRGIEELLELLDPLLDTRFLDLCCGEGQLSIGALTEGVRSVVAVDGEPRMLSHELRSERAVEAVIRPVHEALEHLLVRQARFDRVVCRQAVNYWLNAETARLLSEVLNPQAIFVFNTFNAVPSKEPRVLRYEMGGHHFVETSWLEGGMVHHVQERDGLAPHHTSFRWIPPMRFRELLEPYFEVQEHWKGKASLYRCVKK